MFISPIGSPSHKGLTFWFVSTAITIVIIVKVIVDATALVPVTTSSYHPTKEYKEIQLCRYDINYVYHVQREHDLYSSSGQIDTWRLKHWDKEKSWYLEMWLQYIKI